MPQYSDGRYTLVSNLKIRPWPIKKEEPQFPKITFEAGTRIFAMYNGPYSGPDPGIEDLVREKLGSDADTYLVGLGQQAEGWVFEKELEAAIQG